MTICKVCGYENNPASELYLEHEMQFFDTFECAFYTVAPLCACCRGVISGSGIEIAGVFFCCVHCACEAHACELEPAYTYSAESMRLAFS